MQAPLPHAIEGLIDGAVLLKNRGQEAACSEFGDQQVDVTGLGGQGSRPVVVALAEAILVALMAVSDEHRSDFQLDQLLQAVTRQLRDQL